MTDLQHLVLRIKQRVYLDTDEEIGRWIKEYSHRGIKTKKDWIQSNKELTEFLYVGDEIDEALYNYVVEVVASAYCSHGFGQCGEPEYHIDKTSFHVTVHESNQNRYYYLGILPLFK